MNCTIKLARRSPEARQRTSGRSTAIAAPVHSSSQSRGGGSRPAGLHSASRRSSLNCRSDSRGSPANGSPSTVVAPTRPRRGRPRSPAPARSFPGSIQVTPDRLTIRLRPGYRQPSFQGEPIPGRFQDQRFRLQLGSGSVRGGGHQETDELGDGIRPVLKCPADAERLAVGQQPGEGPQPDPRRVMPARHFGSGNRLNVTLRLDPEPEIDAGQSGLQPLPARLIRRARAMVSGSWPASTPFAIPVIWHRR